MKKILFYCFYEDPNEERRKELNFCLQKNINSDFDIIYILSEANLENLLNLLNSLEIKKLKCKIYIEKINYRPTFNKLLELSCLSILGDVSDSLFFIINSDIYFENLHEVERFFLPIENKKETFLCLSRWDLSADKTAVLVDREDSQDAWIFYNKFDKRLSRNIEIGIPGCDNALAYELYKHNFNLLNPCETIKIYHLHNTKIRRYYCKDKEVNDPFLGNETKRIEQPYFFIEKYEKLLTKNFYYKVISFCLYGNDPKYCQGAIENCKLAKHIYPDWICRFYISKDVNIKYISEILNYDNVEIFLMNKIENHNSMFWRFLPISDGIVDVMISRDCDSRLCMREKYAVDEWLKSDKGFHIMRDHPLHTFKIMGGMFGVKKDCIKNFSEIIKRFNKQNQYNCDQFFLQDCIYPLIESNCMVHDMNNFPTLRSKTNKFVGEIYDGNNIRHPDHYKMIQSNN